jgi:uncharacterized protein YbaP (TraB family)
MLKSFTRALLGLFLSFAPLAAGAQAVPSAKPADPALWVVKDKDTTIYLFGTIHALRPGINWFQGQLKKAFDSSDTLVTEIVLPDPASASAAMLKAATNPAGPTLTEKLPADKRAAYVAALTKLGIPPTTLDRYDPWFVATQIGFMTMLKSGYDPASGSERVLTDAAAAEKKPVAGLETVEDQIGFLDGLSDQAQQQFLVSTIDEIDGFKAVMDKMVASWTKGDAEGIAKLLNDDMDDSPELMQKLIADRDARWADWIAKRLDQPGTVFIAVGAGHLSGPQSVQAYLARKNIQATRIAY